MKKSKKKEKDEEESKESTATILYRTANSKIKRLYRSEENSSDVYAVVNIDGKIETFSLNSQRAKHWIRTLEVDGSIIVHHKNTCETVLGTIEAEAQMDEVSRKKIHNRIAFEKDTLYYDLAGTCGDVVKVDKNDIDIILPTYNTPLFRRGQNTYPQIEPEFGDPKALDKFAQLTKVKDEQVFLVHLVSEFLPDIPSPIMFFEGEAGTMKSTDSALVKSLVDPSGPTFDHNLKSMSSKIDDMAIGMYNNYVTAYNNISKISQSQSDLLCCGVTGGSNDKRKLYTDMDESIMSIKRKLILNGVAPVMEYPDLLDRILFYERKPLMDGERLTDAKIQQRFQRLLPYVLGQVFQTIQRAIKIHKELEKKLNPQTRLGDFEVWGEAISRALGYEPNTFLEKFYEKIRQQSALNKDSYPIIRVIEKILYDHGIWVGSVTECWTEIRKIAEELGIDVTSFQNNFPKSPSALSRELTKITPILEKSGINVEKYPYTYSDGKYDKNTAMICLSKDGEGSEDNSSSLEKTEEKNSRIEESYPKMA